MACHRADARQSGVDRSPRVPRKSRDAAKRLHFEDSFAQPQDREAA